MCSITIIKLFLSVVNGDLIFDFFIHRGALIVDTSVGGVLDYSALANVLTVGRVSAIIDVVEKEPIGLDKILRYMPNVTLMPHMAGAASDTRSVIARELLRECAEYINDGIRPKHEISLYAAKKRKRWTD